MVDSPHKTGSDVIPVNPKQPGFRQGATPSMVVVDGSSVVHASVVVKATMVLSASSVPRVTVWSHRYSSSWWLNQPVFEKHSVKNGIIFPVIFQNLWNPPPAKTPRMCKRIAICFCYIFGSHFRGQKKLHHLSRRDVSSLQVCGPPLGFFSPATSSACSLTRASCCNWLAPEASNLQSTPSRLRGVAVMWVLTLFSSSWYWTNWFPK